MVGERKRLDKRKGKACTHVASVDKCYAAIWQRTRCYLQAQRKTQKGMRGEQAGAVRVVGRRIDCPLYQVRIGMRLPTLDESACDSFLVSFSVNPHMPMKIVINGRNRFH